MTAINFDTLAYSKDLDASERDKLATKGDFADVHLELEKLRLEVEKLRDETNFADVHLELEKLCDETN